MKINEERQGLENMLQNSPAKIDNNVATPGDDMAELRPEPLTDVNFDELRRKAEREARSMIKNAVQFMVPMDMIRENKYLKNKFKVDVMTLGGMLYQLRTNELMQKTLMQQINSGLIHARYYEVYGGLSKTIGDLNKQLLQTVEAIKETYKVFKNDVKENRTEAMGPSTSSNGMITTGNGGVITRGTKELIKNVQNIKSLNSSNEQIVDQQYLDNDQLIPKLDI
jgi:hypothetical protein